MNSFFRASQILAAVTFLAHCGAPAERRNSRSARPLPQDPALTAGLVGEAVAEVEALLVSRANDSLQDHVFAQKKTWRAERRGIKTDNHVHAAATAAVQSFTLQDFKKLSDSEYLLTFAIDLTVKISNATYREGRDVKVSMSDVKLPTVINSGLYIHWELKPDDDLEFAAGPDGKFLNDLTVKVTAFEYESTFLHDLPARLRQEVRAKLRDVVNKILKGKDDSVVKKIDTDLNKLTKKDKLSLTKFLHDVDRQRRD